MLRDKFPEHVAKIRGQGEVPVFVKLFRSQAGPFPVHFAAPDRAAENAFPVGVVGRVPPYTVLGRTRRPRTGSLTRSRPLG